MARKKLLIAAVVVGLFAAFLVYLYGQQQEEKVEEFVGEDYTHEVVVAAADIPATQPLHEEAVTTREVPEQFLPANPLSAEDVDIYLGQPVSQDIDAGAMILTSDFAVSDEVAETLSARVPTGERAMTISVNAISGVAGLLRPGDRVDILGTFPVQDEDELIPEAAGGMSRGYLTMSLLQNVTLLAVGAQISQQSEGHHGYGNVTLSLTPDETELLTLAQTRGDLDLVLRNREDMEQVPVNRRTLRDVLEELDVLNEDRKERVEQGPPPCPPNERRVDGECVQDLEIIRGGGY